MKRNNVILWAFVGLFVAMMSACGVSTDDDGVALFPVRDHGKWGFINKEGKMIIEPKYDSVGRFSEGLCVVTDTSIVGSASGIHYINKKGQSPFNLSKNHPKTFGYAGEFNNGIAITSSKGRGRLGIYSLLDKSGNEIQEKFDTVPPGYEGSITAILPLFSYDPQGLPVSKACGYAFYSENWDTNEGKWGFATMDWKTVHYREYDEIGSHYTYEFSDGLLPVRVGDKWGFIDMKGDLAITPQFDEVQNFYLGYAWVKQEDKWGTIDKKGNWQIEPKFNDRGYSVGKDMHIVEVEDGFTIINNKGEIISENRFEDIYGYENDTQDDKSLALVKVFANDLIQYAMIDDLGNIVIGPYEELSFFSEGLAIAGIFAESGNYEEGYKAGYLNTDGQFVIEPAFVNTRSFSEGLAAVTMTIDGKYGYIDKTGQFVIQPQFDEAYGFENGLAEVLTNGKRGLIDKTGKFVLEAKYDHIYSFVNGLAIIIANGKMGFIDPTGKVVLEPKYDKLYYFENGLACFEIGGKMGYLNEKFETVYMEK